MVNGQTYMTNINTPTQSEEMISKDWDRYPMEDPYKIEKCSCTEDRKCFFHTNYNNGGDNFPPGYDPKQHD